MHRATRIIATLVLTAWAGSACAIKWADKTVADPIDPTKKCAVREPMSWGSYIYEFPSKYDMVFWPVTTEAGLWSCEGTGFVALIDDFKGIPEAERAAIAAWLKGRDKPTDIRSRLQRLEAIYAMRQEDAAFRNRLLRTLARWYQDLGDLQRANDYRREALAQIVSRLRSPMDDWDHLQYLYLAANYTRLFGDAEASDAWLAQLRVACDGIQDPKKKDAVDYLRKLAAQTPAIQPGGKLDPPEVAQ